MSWDLFLDENENDAPISNTLSMPMFPSVLNDQIVPDKNNLKDGFLNGNQFSPNPNFYSDEAPTSKSFSNLPKFVKNKQDIVIPKQDEYNKKLEPIQTTAPSYAKIQFHPNRLQVAANSNKINFSLGDYVVTEADRGYDVGQVVEVIDEENQNPINCPNIIRKASQEEVLFLQDKRQREENAIKICQEKANELKLPMTITSTEYQFDGKKLTVYFTANTYIDFRKLVNALFRVFGIRIWMVWYDGKAPVRDVFTHNEDQQKRVFH